MNNPISTFNQNEIENLIFTIRGKQVMLDSNLAEMYGVEIKRLNEQVKRNITRFPQEFMFQINESELDFLRSQIAILKSEESLRSQIATLKDKRGSHRKYLPYVFTEQGVAMLSAILRSETAVKVSIQIMNAFIEMRKFIIGNAALFQRLESVEHKQLEADNKFERIFRALESSETKPENGIFFDGQVFDAYVFISDLIRSANTSISLIDNYIDESVLLLLTKRKPGVNATIYTKPDKALQLDMIKHNSQYAPVEIKELSASHDRFLIIDEKELYHIGASLKDLGKKWFAFSKIDSGSLVLLKKLNELK
jgi:phage regulator Rha-like protein